MNVAERRPRRGKAASSGRSLARAGGHAQLESSPQGVISAGCRPAAQSDRQVRGSACSAACSARRLYKRREPPKNERREKRDWGQPQPRRKFWKTVLEPERIGSPILYPVPSQEDGSLQMADPAVERIAPPQSTSRTDRSPHDCPGDSAEIATCTPQQDGRAAQLRSNSRTRSMGRARTRVAKRNG